MKEKFRQLCEELYDVAYEQGLEDGKKGYRKGYEQGYFAAYDRGFEDGKKNHEKVRNADMGYGYRRGLEDAWECARKITGGEYDNALSEIFGNMEDYQIIRNYTADQAMKKIMDYEERQTKTITYPQVDGVTPSVVPEDSESTQPPRRKWTIVKPNWIQIPKCRDCKYFESALMPCNRCRDNSQFEPAEQM